MHIDYQQIDYTSNYLTSPIAPESITQLNGKKIVEQGVTSYGVFVEWTPVEVAKTYTIQWTINPDYFDDAPELVNSQTTEEGSGPKILLTNIIASGPLHLIIDIAPTPYGVEIAHILSTIKITQNYYT